MPSTLHRCPNCFHQTLLESRVGRQAVMQCDDCLGVWFEDGALNRAIAHKHDDIDHYDHELHLGEKTGQGGRLCRRCDLNMERFHLLEHYEVEVDCCPKCDGVWLDREEVDQTMHSPVLRDALTKLTQRTTWKSLVFQFLTGMPVEYNLKPHKTPWVTYAMMVICTLIFVAGQLDAQLENSLYLYLGFNSNAPGLLQAGQLITHQFMHGSWLHLLGNMYFLWLVGDNIEDTLGHWRFLGLYLIAGVVAALTEWAFFDGSQGPLLLVGASGAIAALFGLYLMWFRHASLTMLFFVIQVKLAPHWYFLIWSLTNIFGMIIGESNVAYLAHLGGLVFGVLVGWLLYPRVLANNPMLKWLNQPEIKLKRFSGIKFWNKA